MFGTRFVAALVVAGGAAIFSPHALAASEQRAAIDGFDVEQVSAVGPGVPLHFSVYGTPNASVTLRVEGGWHLLALEETSPGIYEGTYVVDARDAIGAASRVSATLERAGERTRADLDEPLLLAATPLPWADAAAAVAAGTSHDVAAPRAPVVADVVPPPTRREICDDCARVEAIRAVVVPPRANDALPDRIARAVLGDELGREHTERMRRLVGALTGRPPDPALTTHSEYDVVLRMRDGAVQVRRYAQLPPFAEGATVRLGVIDRPTTASRF